MNTAISHDTTTTACGEREQAAADFSGDQHADGHNACHSVPSPVRPPRPRLPWSMTTHILHDAHKLRGGSRGRIAFGGDIFPCSARAIQPPQQPLYGRWATTHLEVTGTIFPRRSKRWLDMLSRCGRQVTTFARLWSSTVGNHQDAYNPPRTPRSVAKCPWISRERPFNNDGFREEHDPATWRKRTGLSAPHANAGSLRLREATT